MPDPNDTTVRTTSKKLVDNEIDVARTEYLAAFGIYQRNPTEENRLAQKRAYDRLEELHRTYAQGRMTMYEFICQRMVKR